MKSFLSPYCKAITKIDRVTEVAGNLAALAKQDVLVGIPQDHSSRKGEEITNAELMFIHTNGSPLNHIPARPVLQPAIEKNKEQIAAAQKRVIQDALNGKADLVTTDMNKLGKTARDLAKGWFVDPRNGWPPNSPETAARKIAKKYKSDIAFGQAMHAFLNGDQSFSEPLIDTGALRAAITYVIRNKE